MPKVYRPGEIQALLKSTVAHLFAAEDRGLALMIDLDINSAHDLASETSLGLTVDASADVPGSVPAKATAKAGAARQGRREGEYELRLRLVGRTTAAASPKHEPLPLQGWNT